MTVITAVTRPPAAPIRNDFPWYLCLIVFAQPRLTVFAGSKCAHVAPWPHNGWPLLSRLKRVSHGFQRIYPVRGFVCLLSLDVRVRHWHAGDAVQIIDIYRLHLDGMNAVQVGICSRAIGCLAHVIVAGTMLAVSALPNLARCTSTPSL